MKQNMPRMERKKNICNILPSKGLKPQYAKIFSRQIKLNNLFIQPFKVGEALVGESFLNLTKEFDTSQEFFNKLVLLISNLAKNRGVRSVKTSEGLQAKTFLDVSGQNVHGQIH